MKRSSFQHIVSNERYSKECEPASVHLCAAITDNDTHTIRILCFLFFWLHHAISRRRSKTLKWESWNGSHNNNPILFMWRWKESHIDQTGQSFRFYSICFGTFSSRLWYVQVKTLSNCIMLIYVLFSHNGTYSKIQIVQRLLMPRLRIYIYIM